MTYHVQILLLVRQPLFDRAALLLTQTSWVLPPLSVGKMTLRLRCIKLQPWSFKRAEFWHRTPERIREDALRIHAPFRLRRRGVETKLVLGNPVLCQNSALLK